MSNAKILNLNYVDPENYFAFSYSSQLAAAPASNIVDKMRRSKVWRSSGYFKITSANKGIVFRESVGVNLTANIAEAAYTSDSAFLTAVKAALDAAGDSTYTVERVAATGLIKITSNGSGGGGIFQLMWTNVASTAATVLGYSTAADDTGALNYTADVVRIHTSEWIVIDMGSASNPSAFVLAGKRNSALGISSTATVKIQGNGTDVWTAPSFDQTVTYSEDGMSYFSDSGFGAYRYWRIEITDLDNPNGYIEVSNIYLGEVFETAQGRVQFPFDIEYRDYSQTEESDNGVSFSDIKQQTLFLSLDWFALTKEDVETLRDFVEHYGTYYPFFIALDPLEAFSTDENKWVKMCRFASPPTFSLVSPNVFTSDWELKEEL